MMMMMMMMMMTTMMTSLIGKGRMDVTDNEEEQWENLKIPYKNEFYDLAMKVKIIFLPP